MSALSPPPSKALPLTNNPTTNPPTQQPAGQESSDTFPFPAYHSFPPFYTLQPNLTTLSRQLTLWSSLITSYHAHHRLFRLSLPTALSTSPLFHNPRIARRLDPSSLRRIIDYMCSAEGERRAEWVVPGGGGPKGKRLGGGGGGGGGAGDDASAATATTTNKTQAWIWWKRKEEWAEEIAGWVDGTGQRGSVLTVYELREGEESGGTTTGWKGMEEDMFRACLTVLVKAGRAQVFHSGSEEEGAEGVKFF